MDEDDPTGDASPFRASPWETIMISAFTGIVVYCLCELLKKAVMK